MPAAEEPEPEASVEQGDAGCESIPADLVELHEVLEWEAAVAAESERET